MASDQPGCSAASQLGFEQPVTNRGAQCHELNGLARGDSPLLIVLTRNATIEGEGRLCFARINGSISAPSERVRLEWL